MDWPGERSYNGKTVSAARLVLVVDDDPDTREMYGWCLETQGCRVRLAGSVAAALSQAAEDVPDVVITDYNLPGGDGFTLAAALRDSPRTSLVPLVLLSGRSFDGPERERASQLFNLVLLKPVLPEELATQVVLLSAGGSASQLIS